ncbi:MAG TPA: hypothetical protein VH206_17275 [Xanthobacteraceae bacterium]|jgi:hypothetical protein|nr:hypothetical protein [Xanthobacteraceae bacterium]
MRRPLSQPAPLPPEADAFFATLEHAIVALSDEDFDRYWINFGRFILAYAHAEHELLRLLRYYAAIEDDVAAVLFAGTRMDAAKRHINAILEAQKQKRVAKRLKRAFDQFGTINTIRNNMLHWEISAHNADTFTISNAFLTPRRKKLRKYRISTTDMEAMRADLHRIVLWLWLERSEHKIDRIMRAYLARPWQYKLPQTSARPKTSQGRRRNPSQIRDQRGSPLRGRSTYY